jgi:hypothetical protein
VVAWAVGAKVLEDGGERCVGHGDLEEVVAKWDLFAVSGLSVSGGDLVLPCYHWLRIHPGKTSVRPKRPRRRRRAGT